MIAGLRIVRLAASIAVIAGAVMLTRSAFMRVVDTVTTCTPDTPFNAGTVLACPQNLDGAQSWGHYTWSLDSFNLFPTLAGYLGPDKTNAFLYAASVSVVWVIATFVLRRGRLPLILAACIPVAMTVLALRLNLKHLDNFVSSWSSHVCPAGVVCSVVYDRGVQWAKISTVVLVIALAVAATCLGIEWFQGRRQESVPLELSPEVSTYLDQLGHE